MKKKAISKIAIVTILSFFINTTLTQANCVGCGTFIRVGSDESIVNALNTELGQKMMDYLEQQGETIRLDKAISISKSKSNITFIPVTSDKSTFKGLCLIRTLDGDDILTIIQMDLLSPKININFPSGKNVIVGIGGSMKVEYSGVAFQEQDDSFSTSLDDADILCATFYILMSSCSFCLMFSLNLFLTAPICIAFLCVLSFTSPPEGGCDFTWPW